MSPDEALHSKRCKWPRSYKKSNILMDLCFNKRSAWSIDAAVCLISERHVFEFLQLFGERCNSKLILRRSMRTQTKGKDHEEKHGEDYLVKFLDCFYQSSFVRELYIDNRTRRILCWNSLESGQKEGFHYNWLISVKPAKNRNLIESEVPQELFRNSAKLLVG